MEWRRKLWASPGGRFDTETIVGAMGFDIDAQYEAYLPGFGWVGAVPHGIRSLWHDLLEDILPEDFEFLGVAVYYDDEFDLTAGSPYVGLRADWYALKWASLRAEAIGMYVGSYGHFYDLEGSIGVHPWKWLDIRAGYRYMYAEVEDDDDEYEVEFSGIFGELNFKF